MSNFVGKSCKFLTRHYLNSSFLLITVKVLNAFTLLRLTNFAHNLLILNLYYLFLLALLLIIFFDFRSTWVPIFWFSSCGHVWRFNIPMLIFHMCIESSIWSISLTARFNSAKKLFRNLLILSSMYFWMVLDCFCFLVYLVWLIHVINYAKKFKLNLPKLLLLITS